MPGSNSMCVTHIVFIYSSVDGHVEWFHNLVPVNIIIIKNKCEVPLLFSDFDSFSYVPRNDGIYNMIYAGSLILLGRLVQIFSLLPQWRQFLFKRGVRTIVLRFLNIAKTISPIIKVLKIILVSSKNNIKTHWTS